MRATSTAFSSRPDGTLCCFATRPSCCAYCNGGIPAKLITTWSVNSGVSLDGSRLRARLLSSSAALFLISSSVGTTRLLFQDGSERRPRGFFVHAVIAAPLQESIQRRRWLP